jgi:hypothetical protein
LLIATPALFLTGAACTPAPRGPASSADSRLAPAYERSAILDPRLQQAADRFRAWVLEQKAPSGAPLFSRVEALPVTVTTMPYGIGAYQQEPRLPVIVTTGSGWQELTRERRERQTAAAARDLFERVQQSGAAPPILPTLTVQTPQGYVLAWINDLAEGKKLLHGDVE